MPLRVGSVAVVAKRATASKKRARSRKPRTFCYTEDLTEALGSTRRTVYNYVQQRLLPAPILYSDGFGVRCRWTWAAMEHADFINEQRALGYNLTEITAMIAARWGTQDKVPPGEPSKKRRKVARDDATPKVDTGSSPEDDGSTV